MKGRGLEERGSKKCEKWEREGERVRGVRRGGDEKSEKWRRGDSRVKEKEDKGSRVKGVRVREGATWY